MNTGVAWILRVEPTEESVEAALEALSGALWSTVRITWIGILVLGFFLAVARTMRTVARTRGEQPFQGTTSIFSLETLVLFWGRLKHLLCGMTGALRLNEAISSGRGLCSAIRWMMMRLPADRVSSTEAMLAEDAKKPVVPPVAAPKQPRKKSRSSKVLESQVLAAPAQPQAATQAHKKRHSMPTLVPTVSSSAAFEQSLESQLHMIAEDQEEKHAEEALAAESSEAESATGDEQQVRTWRSMSKDGTAEQGTVAPGSAPSTVDVVQSRFAKYFHSISEGANAIPSRGDASSTGTQDEIEAQLKSGTLLSPPGYGRRTKSMAPSGKYQPPMTVSVPTETLAPTQHSYRRPTGTFASKGYALTRASVFAARASPVPENMAPLEKRTKDFFSHRKSSGASTGSSSRASSPGSEGRPVAGALSAVASPHKVFEPAGRRRSFYPPSWTPWTDEESVAPAGSRAAGVIGSRAGSTASPDAQDDPQQGSFSLFNMDLFHATTSPFGNQ